ncbi:hypothetical protein BDZ45DRAFT_698424 [Acephala macrosclerotiorum]|nr:hypothetical protein BDZ45DRAFT_698424 [Acephala macrosclerotiorum]
MISTEYINQPEGKRVAIAISSGEDFMSLTDLHFLFDSDEAPYHVPPRDIHPPGYLQTLEDVPKDDQPPQFNTLCERCSTIHFKPHYRCLMRNIGVIRQRIENRNPLWPYELHVVSAAYVHFAEQKGGAVNMPEILAARGITDTTAYFLLW